MCANLLMAACAIDDFNWQDGPDGGLAAYKQSFTAAVGDRFVAGTTWPELQQRLRGCRVLWLGDEHDDVELHGRHLQVLQSLHEAGFRLALGLEAIGQQDEPLVAEYLDGRMDMERLREAMRRRWSGSWLDDTDLDSAHFRALLSFGKRHGLPVFALEPTPRLPLRQRDAIVVSAVQAAAERYPDRLLVVVVGQSHLLGTGAVMARCRLPSQGIGATPPSPLRQAATADWPAASLLQSSGGLWFFADRVVP